MVAPPETFSVLVEVRLRPGIADPQGATIERALPALGLKGIAGVRAGKAFRFDIVADDEAAALAQGTVVAERVLANPVIEESSVTITGKAGGGLMAARVGVVMFPGTNCEHDVVHAIERLGGEAELVWHGDSSAAGYDALVLPGGFAHGDYLRPGAIARFSPVMEAVSKFAADGGPVVGICNGFQVLTEAGLLPGALQKNRGLRFLCTTVEVRVETDRSVLTAGVSAGTVLSIPINHFEGNFTCDAETLARLQRDDRVILRYVDNPNGSIDAIAGVCNEARNVVGLMPHPERASDPLTGSVDGAELLSSLLASALTAASADVA